MSDVVVIGAGHNALAAAFYLARGGRRPLVLERRAHVGGGAVTTELHPGFRCPTLSHEVLLDARIVADMDLGRRVEFLSSPARSCALVPGGAPVIVRDDANGTALRAVSAADAEAYPRFRHAVARVAGVLGATFDAPPPDVDAPGLADLWHLLQAGRRFRSLGRRDGHRLLQWLPMPVADLVTDWFEHPALRSMLAAPGLSGTMLGPRSAGSMFVMLLREAARQRAGGTPHVRGGPGALTSAMAEAAREAGAEIRTGVGVEQILARDGRVTGVVAGGQEIASTTVVSCVDPRTTLLTLLDPAHLDSETAGMLRTYRASGTLAKVNLALARLPIVPGVDDTGALAGRIHVGPDLDYLERAFDHAKYGEFSDEPWLDVRIPSLVDASLAPAGAHVASIYAHYAPHALRAGDWGTARDTLLSRVLRVLESCMPGVSSLVLAADVVTPADLQHDHGYAGGHVFHGELSLDQWLIARPVPGMARYATPVRGLWLSGAGTHPGGFATGTSGRLAARLLLSR
jgi:phytoene dehydrogenase-like protein